MDPQPFRVCARCHVAKAIDEFPIKDASRGTRRSYCRPCCREYGKEHYRRNTASYRDRARAQRSVDRPRNREFIAVYLSAHPCVDCGEADPVVLEFDHRDPDSKLTEVGHLIHSGQVAVLRSEIEKCDVRCGNCHRIRTAIQFGSYRLGEDVRAYRV